MLDGAGPAGGDRPDLDGGVGARGADRGGHLGATAGGDGDVSDVLDLVGDPHAAGGRGVGGSAFSSARGEFGQNLVPVFVQPWGGALQGAGGLAETGQ